MSNIKDKAFKARQTNVSAAIEHAFKIFDVLDDFYNDDFSKASLRDIAGTLNTLGYKTRQGKKWHANTVKRILKYHPSHD